MDFQRFLREIKPEIEFLYPKNQSLGLALFFWAIARQVVEKDDILAQRIVKHLKDMSPLIKLLMRNPDKKWALADFRLPDMRGRVKPKKRLQNISEEYRNIYERVKPILKRRYRNPEAKLLHLEKSLGRNFPKDKLREWLDCKPTDFACKCFAYKYEYDRHPETILRYVRKERKDVKTTYKLLRKLAEQPSSPKTPSPPIPS